MSEEKNKPVRRISIKVKADEIQENSWFEYVPFSVADRFRDDLGTNGEQTRKRVLAWNFVDENGEPLPQPQTETPEGEPTPFERLTTFEWIGLIKAVFGGHGPSDLKN